MKTGCVRWIALVAAGLLFLAQAPLAAAQDTIFKEDFSHSKQIKGEVFPSLTYLLMALLKPSQARELTWSHSSKLGPGPKARLPKAVKPPILTGHDKDYWVGRLQTNIGWLTIGDSIDVSQYSDLKLKLRWAAAEEAAGEAKQNHFEADEYVIIVAYYQVNGRWDVSVVDQFEGNKKSAALTSKLTKKTSQPVFTDEVWNLQDRLGLKKGARLDKLNFLIIVSNDTEFVGFDTLEVTGSTVGAQDFCPDDPNKTEPGLCGCGIADTDSDGDGTPNCLDQCPNDAAKTAPGACGCGTADTDSDGDGTPNCNDQCPADPNKTEPGACGCGKTEEECADGCPDDPNKTEPGVCGCGTPDTDTDGDGTPNCLDQCPNDAAKTAPGTCGCGTAETDTDGDGTPDCNDQCPSDPNKTTPGECGCGLSEDECGDNCPDDPDKTEPGICGCGTPDTDSDGDGMPDCNDACPNDAAKTAPGLCGCGVSDATPLCLFNGDFQTGDLTNWTANNGSGSVSVELEDGVGNYAGKLVTGSPVSLSINVNTPDEFFWITFDTKFVTTAGELTVRLNGVELLVVAAPATPDVALKQHVVAVHQTQLRNLALKPLSFTFDGPTGSEMFIDNVAVIPGSAGEECVHGGDSIGPDSSWTDGWGANTANGAFEGWFWHHNGGHPAVLYTSDGHSPLVSVRSIVAAVEHTDGNGTNWSKYNWTIDIWPLNSYLSKGQPIKTVNLGAEPDNWSGFIHHSVRLVTPDTEPFGVPGGNAPAGTVSYELLFDLRHVPALAEPLPAGEYIVGFQSRHGMASFGTTGMLSSRVGIGPEPYYSATDRDVPIEPTKVIGALTQNELFRWALSFTERKLSCP